MQPHSTSRISGAIVVATAGLLILGRVLGLSGLPALIPGGDRMGLLNMVMMACAGGAIMIVATPWRQLPRARRLVLLACMVVLALLPLGFLIETIFSVSIGIDIPVQGARASALIPHPGRTSPNGAVAFLLIDLALLCLIAPQRRGAARLGWLATWGVGLIGSAALIGHALGLQDLYRVVGYNRLLPVSAVAMCLCAAGLWSLIEPALQAGWRSAGDAEQRINRRSAALFALVTVIGGVAGFAVLRTSFEEATARNLLLTARTTATSIASEIEANLWYPKVIVARSSVRTAMARLGAMQPPGVDSAAAHDALARLAERFFNEQVTGAQFLDPEGNMLFSSGTLSIKVATVRHRLRDTAGGAVLFWADGYVLETRNDVVDDGRTVGVLVVETRLPRIHELLGEVQESGPTTDTALCGMVERADADGAGAGFACGPTRFHRDGLRQSLQVDQTSVGGTLAMALAGESGTRFVSDAWNASEQRGRVGGGNVIAAYTPVKQLGLALGVRSDVESLYAPLRGRVLQLLLVLAAVVVAGTFILRNQVRPLVTALGREQRRTARILQNSNDAFVALDQGGRITDWNAQAERMFGWSEREAMGRRLPDLILPPGGRAELAAAMVAGSAGAGSAGYNGGGSAESADGASHRIELLGVHRDGHTLPIEVSLRTERTDDGYLAHVFIQDISARKAAREALHQSEQRLRLIANNLPALVSYIDRDFRYRFTNNQYQRWFNLQEDALVGKTVAEVFGADVFENVRAQIEAALAGEDVAFELRNDIAGAPTDMQVHYIPDRDQHGAVIGVFGMVLDQTAQRLAQAQVETSERQLRAVTDNLPILISYVDSEEKLRFMNGTFRDWLGIDLHGALGRTIAEVIGDERYQQRSGPLRRALAGERQEFDIESSSLSGRRHLHTVYIPDARDDGGVRGVFTVSMDVTRLKLIEDELRNLSSLDTLTGLPNRRQLNDRLNLALARHHREQTPLALMFIDIDKFKTINDTLGHAAGDKVLQIFATRLTRAVRDSDTVARLGGDEFIVVVEGLGSAQDAAQVAEKILAAVRMPFTIDGAPLEVRACIGIAVSAGSGQPGRARAGATPVSRDSLMEAADRALYRAKQAGRDRYDLETLDRPARTAPLA